MFVDALAFGFMAAIGIFILLWRLPRILVLHLLGMGFLLDTAFTTLMFWMHWGTAIGMFVATIGGLFGSAGISLAKGVLGSIDFKTKQYKAGWFDDRRPPEYKTTPPAN